MRKIVVLVVTLTFVVCGGILADTDYKYVGEFLNVGAGARALGMGGAFVAVADDGTTAYWSPGGLPTLQSKEVAFMHCQQFDSLVKTNFISYVHPTSSWGAFGISWLRLGVEDIPKSGYVDSNGNLKQDYYDWNDNAEKDPGELYIEPPVVVGYFDDIEDGILLSYGIKLSEYFSMGANLKIIRQSISVHQSSGFGLDIGVLYQLFDGFKLGLNLQDLPRTKLTWDLTGHEEIIPFSVRAGAAYTRQMPSFRSILTLSYGVNTKYETANHYGAEWWLMNVLALRVGSDDGNFSAGCGLKISTFQVDYAFVGHNDLGSTHRISTSVQF